MIRPSRRRLANAIRFLAADAVQAANSGHAGMPMGMADIAEVLWNDFHRHHPEDPAWMNRDRFILSNGHGSMLQYALLHLAGYAVSIEDLRQFRQLGSITPGHPEVGVTPGVETTTGPLAQGFANAVGFALAERLLAHRYNRPGYQVIDHRTWVFLGDGCLMEGLSHEAASLAGTWQLGKLIAFWDDNGISIDGDTTAWFTDHTPMRFESYGWQVIRDVDGHDPEQIHQAIQDALADQTRPTLICCKTVIGFGAPSKAGTEVAHGSPLGPDEIAVMRQHLHWTHPPFELPADIYAAWSAVERGRACYRQWQHLFDDYSRAHPALAKELNRRIAKQLPADFAAHADALIATLQTQGPQLASRQASHRAIEAFAPLLVEMVGGSADLTHSNLTLWQGGKSVHKPSPEANYIHYGVREFGMSAISNGLALHGGFLPFDATFLVFSDYARNAVRMSAMMSLHVIHVYTHDSIGIGTDGPTHQPVEQLASLRDLPNNDVWRPCDAVESTVAWKEAILRQTGPSCLVFSRQKLSHFPRDPSQLSLIARGGYILAEANNAPAALILLATGSEVAVAIATKALLEDQNIPTRVVSMPSTTVFDRQDADYRDRVLPPSIRHRIAIEAGSTGFWYRYVGLEGRVIGLDQFGVSAPDTEIFAHFNITPAQVCSQAIALHRG